MAVQTDYEIDHAAAVEGAVVDGTLKNMVSGAAEVSIPFGRIVTRGTTGDEVKLPTSSAEVLLALGASVRMQDDTADSLDVLNYEIGRNVSILDLGSMYLRAEDAVTAGGDVFVRFVAGGGEFLGRVRSDADTADAVALPGLEFTDDAGAGELVRVRIRLS